MTHPIFLWRIAPALLLLSVGCQTVVQNPAGASVVAAPSQTVAAPAAALSPTAGASDIVDPTQGVQLGSGWYALESDSSGLFRWADNDATLLLSPPPSVATPLQLDIEPGASAGGQPLPFEIDDSSSTVLYRTTISGRVSLTMTVPAGTTALQLHVDSPDVAVPGDPRTLNFRVYSAGWEDSPASHYAASYLAQIDAPSDVVPSASVSAAQGGQLPNDGLFVGDGWYPVENSGGTTWRWMDNDAYIVVTHPTKSQSSLQVDLQPGPSLGSDNATVSLVDEQGNSVGSLPLRGNRQVWSVNLPLPSEPVVAFQLVVSGSADAVVPNDSRTLNLRVYKLSWGQS